MILCCIWHTKKNHRKHLFFPTEKYNTCKGFLWRTTQVTYVFSVATTMCKKSFRVSSNKQELLPQTIKLSSKHKLPLWRLQNKGKELNWHDQTKGGKSDKPKNTYRNSCPQDGNVTQCHYGHTVTKWKARTLSLVLIAKLTSALTRYT